MHHFLMPADWEIGGSQKPNPGTLCPPCQEKAGGDCRNQWVLIWLLAANVIKKCLPHTSCVSGPNLGVVKRGDYEEVRSLGT